MSITEENNVSKKEETIVTEGEFDIVPANGVNKKFLSPLFIVTLLILVATGSYGLGRYNFFKNEKIPVEIKSEVNKGEISDANLGQTANIESSSFISSAANALNNSKQNVFSEVVASKNGTKYHYPWCSGAKQISEKNKITFASIEEARKAGYLPAANCKGLK